MASTGRPFATAVDAAVPRVECAVKTDVSIPASERKLLIQRLTLDAPTGAKGFLVLSNNVPAAGSVRKASVTVT